MSNADYDPPPSDKTPPERMGEIVGKLKRCPSCRQGVHRGPDGRCPQCGSLAWSELWERATEVAPVEVEELNGGACRDCGAPAAVLRPKRKPPLDPLGLAALLAMFFAGPVLVPRGDAGLPLFFLIVLGMGLPVLYILVRYRRLRLFSTCIVVCDACGLVRIGGRSDERDLRLFLRGRAAAMAARRLLVPAFYFLLAVCTYAWMTGGRTPRSTVVTLGIVSLAVIFNWTYSRAFLPNPRGWWEFLRPW